MAINFGLLNTQAPAEIGASIGNALAVRRQRDLQDEQLAQQREQFQVKNALANMELQKAQADAAEEAAYKNAFGTLPAGAQGATPEMYKASPTRAMAFDKQITEKNVALSKQQQALVDMRAKMTDLQGKKIEMYRSQLPTIETPEQMAQWYMAQRQDPDLQGFAWPTTLDETLNTLRTASQSPQGFGQYKLKVAQGISGFLDANKPAAPTELGRLIAERDALPQGDPRRATYDAAISKSTTHAPANVTNVSMGLEREEQKAKGKSNVELYGEVRNSASVARKLDAQLESQSRVLDRGFDTGFGTETKAAAASVLGALGVKDAEKFATDAQTFTGAAKEVVLQKQLAQKGPQTESDAKRIEQTSSQLGNTSAANRFLIDVARAQNAKDIGQQRFFDDYWRKNGTYEGAENAWYSGEGGKSIFEDKRMKKYEQQTPQKPGASSGPTVGAVEGGYRFRGGNPADPKAWEKVR